MPVYGWHSTIGPTSPSAAGRSTRSCAGYPVRIEVGPRDLKSGAVTLVRRIDGSKTAMPVGEATKAVLAALDSDQKGLFDEAVARKAARTADVSSLDDAIGAAEQRLRPGAVGQGRSGG